MKRHLANLYPKLGVSSRGEAVNKALSEGYISAREVVTHEEVERGSGNDQSFRTP